MIEALGREPLDYLTQSDFIDGQRQSKEAWAGGSTLLPLYFDDDRSREKDTPGNYVILLTKRSKSVQQPGDLCAPGGGIHPFLDSVLANLLRFVLFPGIHGLSFKLARRRGRSIYKRILLLLSIALRESWEELRLSPFNVEFLGVLPTYRLRHRNWIIFPMVGRVKHPWKPKPSWEVEKIVSIPLESFFCPENYAIYSLEVPENLIAQGIPNPWEFPCLVQKQDGEEEILWGATFEVIQTFFKIVFDFSFPISAAARVIHRPLALNYFSGREG